MDTRIADAAAVTSAAIACTTWLVQLNDVLQLIATLVAIAAGVSAARYHWIKARALKV